MEFLARRYDSGELVRIQTAGDKIESVAKMEDQMGDYPTVGPGFLDIQTNGGFGVDFSSEKLTEDGVAMVFRENMKKGVFRFCPTMITNSKDAIGHSVKTVVAAMEKYPELAPVFAGIHMEGPFIASENGPRGAHPVQFCVPYDAEWMTELQKTARGAIRIMTLSPTYDGAADFIRYLKSLGILVSLGHTNATPQQIAEAVDAGAQLSTHLANATHHLIPKSGNYFFAQLTDDRLMASIIADGFHLTPMMMKTILRTKGFERLILISDQAQIAGFPPGRYMNDTIEVEVLPNGKIVLASDTNLLSSASYPVSRGICNMMKVGGLTLEQAYALCTSHPASLLKIPAFSNGDNYNFLAVGKPADFLIFRQEPSQFGPAGFVDTNIQSGQFHYEAIIYRGQNLLK